MAKPVVVDTDVLIDYFAGVSPSEKAVHRLLETDRLAVTTLTVFELYCGVEKAEFQQDVGLLVDAFRNVLRLSIEAARRAAQLFRALKRRGEALPTPELLIAGCCLAADLPLLTRNRQQFSGISHLDLIEFHEIEHVL